MTFKKLKKKNIKQMRFTSDFDLFIIHRSHPSPLKKNCSNNNKVQD